MEKKLVPVPPLKPNKNSTNRTATRARKPGLGLSKNILTGDVGMAQGLIGFVKSKAGDGQRTQYKSGSAARGAEAIAIGNRAGTPVILGAVTGTHARPDTLEVSDQLLDANQIDFDANEAHFKDLVSAAVKRTHRDYLTEMARVINPTNSMTNCTYLVEAVMARLHGTNPTAVAPNLPARDFHELDAVYNTRFIDVKDFKDAFDKMAAAENGATGAIVMLWKNRLGGHIAPITNSLGVPTMIEGQQGIGLVTSAEQAEKLHGAGHRILLGLIPSPYKRK